MERTLLLVDDEENITSALVRLLRRDGYCILRANSGDAGLELLRQNEVGVIISDQRMPGMTGVEFLGKVRDLYPDTVRIVLSGYTELNSVTDAINRGAIYKFFTKPWEDDLLRANVEEAFQRYEMKMENVRLTAELQRANEELLSINHQLEQRVEEKTREVMRNLSILQVSQEVLEHLPVAVIGIGDDGMIAIANMSAHRIFTDVGNKAMVGEAATEVLPAELLACALVGECRKQQGSFPHGPDGKHANYWCCPMGEISHSRGVVIVIDVEP
ncbi:ATP-binding response regulator [Sideroxydans lithotrophicus]|uniref:Response regulator receiver protein n=1 Tax=Sideroxydans lithotrophicus (strain ES-1) TaxID=580332 RepID=D5CRF0_SIDLE|nr:response regulator [Sideroxydans lithotrophicus]ADE11536.1 response regulator receiver protein [Sideroxydans lithotrophicus ES-1]